MRSYSKAMHDFSSGLCVGAEWHGGNSSLTEGGWPPTATLPTVRNDLRQSETFLLPPNTSTGQQRSLQHLNLLQRCWKEQRDWITEPEPQASACSASKNSQALPPPSFWRVQSYLAIHGLESSLYLLPLTIRAPGHHVNDCLFIRSWEWKR